MNYIFFNYLNMFTTKDELINAIKLYSEHKEECIEKYGEPNNWDVTNITDMSYLFKFSKFNCQINSINRSIVVC